MGDQPCKPCSERMNVSDIWYPDGSAATVIPNSLPVPTSFSLSEVGAGRREEDDLFEWLSAFCGRSSCHVIEVADAPRVTLPLGKHNLACGRGLIYKPSNLIFSVWTDCNLVLERNPSESFVVLADNDMASSCPTSEPQCSHICGRYTCFTSLVAISNQHLGDSNLGRQDRSSNSTYAKLRLVQGSRTI